MKAFKLLSLSLIALFTLTACDTPAPQNENQAQTTAKTTSKTIMANSETSLNPHDLTVYKTATCGCCNAWITHLEAADLSVKSIDTTNLDGTKDRLQIPVEMRSCHTAVSADGFVFEGHVPARFVQQFLNDPPANALGLSVPAMPVGSPGMEMGERFSPYEVLLLNKDGMQSVYASVNNPTDQ